MEVRIVVEARAGVCGVNMEVVGGWLNGEECVVGLTEIELREELGLHTLAITADLAVKP